MPFELEPDPREPELSEVPIEEISPDAITSIYATPSGKIVVRAENPDGSITYHGNKPGAPMNLAALRDLYLGKQELHQIVTPPSEWTEEISQAKPRRTIDLDAIAEAAKRLSDDEKEQPE